MIPGKLHRKWLFSVKFYVIFQEKFVQKGKNGLFWGGNCASVSYFEGIWSLNM